MSVIDRARSQLVAPMLRRHGHHLVPRPLAWRSPRIEWMRHQAGWWSNHREGVDLYTHREALWSQVMPWPWAGDYLEFGVAGGESLAWWAAQTPPAVRLFGFDTFTGLPEAWGNQPAGSYTADGMLPGIPDNRVEYVVGPFADTLAPFLASTELRHPLVVHLDADLYRSTLDVLSALAPVLAVDDVLVFDELLDVGTADHEFRAFVEATEAHGLGTEVLAAVHRGRQVAMRVSEPSVAPLRPQSVDATITGNTSLIDSWSTTSARSS